MTIQNTSFLTGGEFVKLYWSNFMNHKNSDNLFSKSFQDFLVNHSTPYWKYIYYGWDEFAMLTMGGEL